MSQYVVYMWVKSIWLIVGAVLLLVSALLRFLLTGSWSCQLSGISKAKQRTASCVYYKYYRQYNVVFVYSSRYSSFTYASQIANWPITEGCKWGMQIDWWLQPRAVFGHTVSGIFYSICHRNKVNCMTLSWWPRHEIVSVTYIYK